MLTCHAGTEKDCGASEGPPRCPLAQTWARLVRGDAEIGFVSVTDERIALATRAPELRTPLSERDAEMLTRALCGYPQKSIASDFDVTVSTVSNRCARALERLAVSPGKIALPLVLAAQSFAALVAVPGGQRQVLAPDGVRYQVVDVARPRTDHLVTLTPAERDVAREVLEGRSRKEIALVRGTSPRTVGVQMRAIADALRVSGRPSLIRRAAELGCFDL